MEFFLETPITSILLVLTVILSWRAFNRPDIMASFIFAPYYMARNPGQWYRFLSSGFIHADGMHLFFNAFVLFQFGRIVELYYKLHFKALGSVLYLALYVLGLAVASLYSYRKHQDNPDYHALGASGAVSGIVFASILFEPTRKLYFVFFPFFGIPAVALGLFYLWYSSYMGKRGSDNIGHDAHFWGAVWGFAFTAALKLPLLQQFVLQIREAWF